MRRRLTPRSRRRAACAAPLLVATVAVLAFFAVSAAGANRGASSSKDTVTLRVQTLTGPLAGNLSAIAKAYKVTHPNIKIQIEALSNVASRQPNVAVLNGSNPPDIGFVQYGAGPYETLLANHKLVPLDSIWNKQKLTVHYGAAVTKQYTVAGHRYIILWDKQYIAPIYYNKDLFAKAGVSGINNHRVTLAQFYDIVAKLKAIGVEGLGMGGNTPYHIAFLPDELLQSATTPAQFQNLIDSSLNKKAPVLVKYTDRPFVAALQTLKDFSDRGVFQSGMLSQDYTQAEALFASQRIGMFIGGTWTPSELTDQLKVGFHYDWFLPPSISTSGQQMRLEVFSGNTSVIPVRAKHIAEAKEFLTFLASKAGQTAMVKGSAALPAFSDLPASALTRLNPVVKTIVLDAGQHGVSPIWGALANTKINQTYSVPEFQALVSGQKSVQQVAQDFQNTLEKIRGSGG